MGRLLSMFERWWFIRVFSCFVVYPTYCFLHRLHVMR